MLLRKSIVLLFSIFLLFELSSQTKYLNQLKYWEYRNSFKKEFIDIGSEKGESIPYAFKYVEDTSQAIFHSSQDLGWYVAVLSTEYYISSKKMYLPITEHEPIEATQVLIELYRALSAIDRIDKNANLLYGCEEETLDGFILRTDLNTHYQEKERIVKTPGSHANASEYVHLIFGLSLTSEFIPNGTIVQGMDLKKTAKKQCRRLIDYLAINDWKIKAPCSDEETYVFGDYNLKPYSKELILIYNRLSAEDKKIKRGFLSGLANFFSEIFKSPYKNSFEKDKRAALSAVIKGKKYRKKTKKLSELNQWNVYRLSQSFLSTELQNPRLDSIIVESEELLNNAPQNGIFSSFDQTQEHEWSTENYFRNSKEARRSENNSTEKIQFNALDYMLFYNLWFIHRTGI